MNKYIIELDENAKEVVVISLEDGDMWTNTMEVDDLEQLNSEYIRDNFGQLLGTCYQKGINNGSLDVKQRVEGAYQRGLDDAWEAAKKIADMWTKIDNDELLAIFGITERIGHSTIRSLFEKQTANEAIEKLKAYEEKQRADDEIKVGDEVRQVYYSGAETGLRCTVTAIDGDCMSGFFARRESNCMLVTG